MSRSTSPRWGSVRFRFAPRTYAPWGCIVRVASRTKSRQVPTRNILPLVSVVRRKRGRGSSRAKEYDHHPHQPGWHMAGQPHADPAQWQQHYSAMYVQPVPGCLVAIARWLPAWVLFKARYLLLVFHFLCPAESGAAQQNPGGGASYAFPDSVWLTARTMHPHGACIALREQNEIELTPIQLWSNLHVDSRPGRYPMYPMYPGAPLSGNYRVPTHHQATELLLAQHHGTERVPFFLVWLGTPAAAKVGVAIPSQSSYPVPKLRAFGWGSADLLGRKLFPLWWRPLRWSRFS